MTHPPRIVVVSREHWPRALLRAQLAEAGYDAIGSGTLSRALRHAPNDAERGPLRVVVVDGGAVAAEREALAHARRRYPGVAFVLLHRAGAVPPVPWAAWCRFPRVVSATNPLLRTAHRRQIETILRCCEPRGAT